MNMHQIGVSLVDVHSFTVNKANVNTISTVQSQCHSVVVTGELVEGRVLHRVHFPFDCDTLGLPVEVDKGEKDSRAEEEDEHTAQKLLHVGGKCSKLVLEVFWRHFLDYRFEAGFKLGSRRHEA